MKFSFTIKEISSILDTSPLDRPIEICHNPGTARTSFIRAASRQRMSMLLNDDEIKQRIESPINLLNRLRDSLNRASPPTSSSSPCLPPKAEDVVANLEEKLINSTAKAKATSLMIEAMDEMKGRLCQVKPEKLADIAYNMARVVQNQEQNRHNHGDKSLSQIIVYAPQVQKIEEFEIIDVVE
jgi:hypothetical protein